MTVQSLPRRPTAGRSSAAPSSYVDTVAQLAVLPLNVRFVAKKELSRTPITVDRFDLARSVADAERVTATLRDGTPLSVFPEGTFLARPGLLPFRLGAFKAAIDTGCPVVPVSIRGTRDVLPGDSWLPRPGPIEVAVGAPLAASGRERRDMVLLRDRVRDEIARSLGEAPGGAHAGLPGVPVSASDSPPRGSAKP